LKLNVKEKLLNKESKYDEKIGKVTEYIFFSQKPNFQVDYVDKDSRKQRIHIFKLEKGDTDMRIDAYNQVSQLYQASKLSKANKAYDNVAAKTNQDQVQISTTGRDYQTAKRAVAGAPEVREEKVAQLKEQMNANTYQVNTEEFAAKLMDKYSGLL
jgi:negative regulator of flagellin synthesis FlgM